MNKIDKIVSLSIDVYYWDKYIGNMAHNYKDIWINKDEIYDDLESPSHQYESLLDLTDDFKKVKELLDKGSIDYIIFRCDID